MLLCHPIIYIVHITWRAGPVLISGTLCYCMYVVSVSGLLALLFSL